MAKSTGASAVENYWGHCGCVGLQQWVGPWPRSITGYLPYYQRESWGASNEVDCPEPLTFSQQGPES